MDENTITFTPRMIKREQALAEIIAERDEMILQLNQETVTLSKKAQHWETEAARLQAELDVIMKEVRKEPPTAG